MGHNNARVIVLVDMDCFYCQVEEKLNPSLKGKPIAVVQYNAWRGGGIIAVNYPARDRGVTRHMRGDEAKKKCPEINVCRVPQVRGKADLNKYRDAGCEVAEVLQKFTPLLERASVDEAYLDITEEVEKRLNAANTNGIDSLKLENMSNTFVVGYENNGNGLEDFLRKVKSERGCNDDGLCLAMGGLVAEEIRKAVYDKTGFKCSAGIGHNKVVAKLVSSLHKPNKQTIIPKESIKEFFETMPLSKIQGLGGKFGKHVAEKLGISYIGELAKFTEHDLIKHFDNKNGIWLYNIGKGSAYEPITTRLIAQSIGCSKRFPGKSQLSKQEDIKHWFGELAQEISERLNKDYNENKRRAKQIVISFSQAFGDQAVSSKTLTLNSYDAEKISTQAVDCIRKFCLRTDGSYAVTFLGMSACNFENVKKLKIHKDIASFFKPTTTMTTTTTPTTSSTNSTAESRKRKFKEISKETSSDEIIISSFIKNKTGRSKANSSFLNDSMQDVSVYSATTEEMFESSSCFDNVNSNNSLNSVNSSNNRLSNNSSPILTTINKGKSSFFKRYLKNSNDDQQQQQQQQDEEEETTNSEKSNWKEQCKECNEMISIFEFDSHKDFHFALELNKSEQIVTSNNGGKKPINKKSGNSNSLLELFMKKNKEEEEEGLFVECEECKKKIKIEQMESHKDYHVAKKLHLEINEINDNGNNKTAKVVTKVQANKKVKKTNTTKNLKSVLSYFKASTTDE